MLILYSPTLVSPAKALLVRALRGSKSETKTSRRCEARSHPRLEGRHQQSISTQHLPHNSRAKYSRPPDNRFDYRGFQRDNRSRAPFSKKPAHRTRRDLLWTTTKPIEARRARLGSGAVEGTRQSDRARALRQWRARRRARRAKEDDPASVGRADQDNQGRV
jgi:hypothetical protein